MIDPTLQTRFAKSSTIAAMDYGAAINQAAFETGNLMIAFWSNVLAANAPGAEQRSWYRPPMAGSTVTSKASDHWAKPSQDWFPAKATPPPAATLMPDLVTAQVSAWQAMMLTPWKLTPTAWPMAYMMMSSGVPESVAVPTASANAAAADAVMAATEAVQKATSSYRSDGGHAVAQVIMLPYPAAAMVAAVAPLASAMLSSPWTALLNPRFGG